MFRLRFSLLLTALFLTSPLMAQQQSDKDVYFSLWKDPLYHGYARPAATYFGTMFNSGWARTVAIDRTFSGNIGLSIPWALCGEKDKSFYVNEVAIPTLIGKSTPVVSPGAPINPIHGSADFLFGLLIPTLEAGFSWWYTAIDFRFMYLPTFSISNDEYGVYWFGFGLRHDIGHYIPDKFPLDFALSWHATWYNLEYTANSDWYGTHTLDGFTHVTTLLIGKRFKKSELFAEIGWDGSSLDASGEMEKRTDAGAVLIPEFETKGSLKGRGGFRIGLNLSLHFGSTSGIGAHYGSQIGGWIRLFSWPGVKPLGDNYRLNYKKNQPAASPKEEVSATPEAALQPAEANKALEAAPQQPATQAPPKGTAATEDSLLEEGASEDGGSLEF